MEFLVNIEIDWPPHADPLERERLFAAELERGQELSRLGYQRRLWRIPGRWANWGLWEAPDATVLHEMISSLPLYPWMNVIVHPLARHQNDPRSLGITPESEGDRNLVGMIDHYLQLCEDRNLADANAFLASDVEFVFPGNRKYRSLQEVVDASQTRYAWVRKTRIEYAVAERMATNESEYIITSIGTLYGERLDGAAFDGIRYIDVFTVRGGRILRQEVWNDLAEAGIVP